MEAVWWCVAVFPSWEKARLVITGGDFNAESYPDEIPQSVAIPYFRNLGVNAILQDDTAYTHRARFINATSRIWEWRRWSCLSWPQPQWTLVGSAWVCRSCQNDQHNRTGLLEQMLVTEWGAIPQQCMTKLVTSIRSDQTSVWLETNFKQEYLVYHGSLRHSKQEKNQLRLDFTILTNSGGFWKMRITK